MSKVKAIEHIEKRGILLVFPIKDGKDPMSLWYCLHPRSTMRWDWDVTGDNRVVKLWHLMKELSDSGEVVYSKWFQSRATFFSKEVFTAYLSHLKSQFDLFFGLTREARQIYEELEHNSPLSTKEIKALCELQGKDMARFYNRAMKQLYQRGLIVSYGEKEDGAFPSSLHGATSLLFEDLWLEADHYKKIHSETLMKALGTSIKFERQLQQIEKGLSKERP